MRIIKDNYRTNIIYPPVFVKCGKCKSIILIEPGDAILNKHLVWEWHCPCCGTDRMDSCSWIGHLIENVDGCEKNKIL